MSLSQTQSSGMIKFKSTNTTHDQIELQFRQNKTVQEYKEQIASLFDYDFFNIKFVFKGKVLVDKEKAGAVGLKNSTVMMVLTKPKKVQKPNLTSQQQTIPKSNLSTGLGSSSPVGFGGYGIVNHPGYMSAISSAVDPEKMQEMLNDPHTEAMIEQMLDDPQTLKQLLQNDPMARQLMQQNPMMKMAMSNPALLKMMLNKDTIKMAREMQKSGTVSPQNAQSLSNSFGSIGGLQNFTGMGGLGGNNPSNFPATNPNANNANLPGSNPFAGMMNNPMFSMMGSGFGNAQNGVNFPNNPLSFANLVSSNNASQANSNESKYSSQIKELNSMGFADKQKCIKFLKQTDGDIDLALQKLCQDDDQKDSKSQQKK